MRNVVLLLVTVLTLAGCSSGYPMAGTVWIRNETASPVSIEVVASHGDPFGSTTETIVVDGVTGDLCNQNAALVGAGPVTIRVSGVAITGVPTFSFTEPQPIGGVLQPDSDYTLDIDDVGHVVLAPGEPPASWQCPGQPAGGPSGSG